MQLLKDWKQHQGSQSDEWKHKENWKVGRMRETSLAGFVSLIRSSITVGLCYGSVGDSSFLEYNPS